MHEPLLVIAEISRPKLVSVAEQAGWSLNWSQTPKTGFLLMSLIYELLHDKTNNITCTPNKDSDQPRHPPSLISLAVRSKGSQGSQAFMRTAKTLIRLRNGINTLSSYDRHGSDSRLSPQCNSRKVIQFSLIIWVYKVCF